MVKVIHADTTSLRGERNVVQGDLTLLMGFDFNSDARLSATFLAQFDTDLNRATGNLTVYIPDFIPGNLINAPGGATHFKLVSAGVEIDFRNKTYIVGTNASPELVIGPQLEAGITLANAITPASTLPLFLGFGIEFYQQVNGVYYPMKNGAHNSVALVGIDAA
jgi:hypothetical protein